MGNNEHEVMADKQRAERIKKVILEHSIPSWLLTSS